MAERLDLTTPEGAVAACTNLTVTSLHLDWAGARITAKFKGDNGRSYGAVWEGATATTLMIALNKANLTSNSLHKRVINQALTDGKLPAGTVSGSPD